jgi:hypothetical protein
MVSVNVIQFQIGIYPMASLAYSRTGIAFISLSQF